MAPRRLRGNPAASSGTGVCPCRLRARRLLPMGRLTPSRRRARRDAVATVRPGRSPLPSSTSRVGSTVAWAMHRCGRGCAFRGLPGRRRRVRGRVAEAGPRVRKVHPIPGGVCGTIVRPGSGDLSAHPRRHWATLPRTAQTVGNLSADGHAGGRPSPHSRDRRHTLPRSSHPGSFRTASTPRVPARGRELRQPVDGVSRRPATATIGVTHLRSSGSLVPCRRVHAASSR